MSRRPTNIIEVCQADPRNEPNAAEVFLASLTEAERLRQLNTQYGFLYEGEGRKRRHIGYAPIEESGDPVWANTPIDYAIMRNDPVLLEVFLRHGADPFKKYVESDGKTCRLSHGRLMDGFEYFWKTALNSHRPEMVRVLQEAAKEKQRPVAVMPEDIIGARTNAMRLLLLEGRDALSLFTREDFVKATQAMGSSLIYDEEGLKCLEILISFPRAPRSEMLTEVLSKYKSSLTDPNLVGSGNLFPRTVEALNRMRELERMFGPEHTAQIRGCAKQIRDINHEAIESEMKALQGKADQIKAAYPEGSKSAMLYTKPEGDRSARR